MDEIQRADGKKKKKRTDESLQGAPVFPPQSDVSKKMKKDESGVPVLPPPGPVFPPQTDVKNKMKKTDETVLQAPVLPPEATDLFFKKEKFNLKTEPYKVFIDRMREKLGAGREKITGIPVMPPQIVEEKKNYIRLDVIGKKTCCLLIRETDVYIIGHITENGVMYALEGDKKYEPEVTRQFSEEGNDPIQFTFNGKYVNLLKAAGIEKVEIKIGREDVQDAIAVLSKPVTKREHAEVANAYLTMIVVIGEAIRFGPIRKKAMKKRHANLGAHLSGWVNHWAGMSGIIATGRAKQEDATFSSPEIRLDDGTPVTTMKQLRRYVKMILARYGPTVN